MSTSIQHRLSQLGIGGVLLALCLMGVVGIYLRQNRLDLEKVERLDRVQQGVVRMGILIRDTVQNPNPRTRSQWDRLYGEMVQDLKVLGFEPAPVDDLRQQLLQDIQALDLLKQEMQQEGHSTEYREHLTNQIFLELGVVSGLITELYQKNYEKMKYTQLQMERMVFLILLINCLIVVAATQNLRRKIMRPLQTLQEGLGKVGKGKLDVQIPVLEEDELGDLTKTFNQELKRLHAVTTSRDELAKEVSEREKAEKHLQEALEKVEASNHELEQFAYVASHDLQEPLRMVASFNQLIAERYEEQLDEEGKRWIGFTVDGVSRMQQMIRDLLEYSRIQTKTGPQGCVQMDGVLDQALLNLQVAVLESGAEISRSNLPPIQGDQARLVQVFQNLIGNAIKFRGEQKPVIQITATPGDTCHEFRIRDNGIGIDPAYATKVFEIFERLNSRKEYPGTGIGLSMVKRIIEASGGEIRFEESPGGGTTFVFTLPSCRSPEENGA